MSLYLLAICLHEHLVSVTSRHVVSMLTRSKACQDRHGCILSSVYLFPVSSFKLQQFTCISCSFPAYKYETNAPPAAVKHH